VLATAAPLFVSIGAALISLVALLLAVIQRRRERVDAVIAGLRGDRKAVTYAAITIRLSQLLRRNDYRRSLIASLLLAWNFETSDRARAAVLAALVDARQTYPDEYANVVEDLRLRFASYESAYSDAKIERGTARLSDVTEAVQAAIEQAPAFPERTAGSEPSKPGT
jgi:hypothetical protein